MLNNNTAIIIGDSYPNTLGLIWSLGKAGIPMVLILVTDNDWSRVLKSKYLNNQEKYLLPSFDSVLEILDDIKARPCEKTIICSNDRAAEFIDDNENILSKYYRTPTRGKKIGKYFNKANQCNLANDCGLVVPQSFIFKKGMTIDRSITFPVITKPLYSTKGGKENIHICNTVSELEYALTFDRDCPYYLVQKYIEKEFELDVLGVRTENGVVWGGAVRKFRHYPPITGAGAYAAIHDVKNYGIETNKVEDFLYRVGYYGLFSVEFVHRDKSNYFMEVNFRNDGLGYAATCAGYNLAAFYVNSSKKDFLQSFHPIYLMNVSADKHFVKCGEIKLFIWVKQFLNTSCYIDINRHDLKPLFWMSIDRLNRLIRKLFGKSKKHINQN